MNIEGFQKLIRYYYKCVRAESEFNNFYQIGQSCLVNLCSSDSFIFNKNTSTIETDIQKINFFNQAHIGKKDIFYGYPLYFKKNRENKKLVAPIFSIKLREEIIDGHIKILKDDNTVRCNIQAFNDFGCEDFESLQEEINNAYIEKTTVQEWMSFLNELLSRFSNNVKFQEILDYEHMSNNDFNETGIYNKNIIYWGEPTNIDFFLLKELKNLYKKNDYEQTSLNIFFKNYENKQLKFIGDTFLIFPYDFDEYKKEAIFLSLQNNHTIITGPPGTGKSQFICNLISNLYKFNQTVLFVSHTNDAIDIVNKKLTEVFPKIIIRTGNKMLLDQLPTQGWNQPLTEVNKSFSTSKNKLKQIWTDLLVFDKILINLWNKKNISDNITSIILKNIKNVIGFLFNKFMYIIYKIFFKKVNYNILKQEEKIFNYNQYLTQYSREWLKNYHANYFNTNLKHYNHTNFLNILSRGLNMNKEQLNLCQKNIKIWSCTLKSLGKIFPLENNIFDYVIFDEASQIDIASAIPAMYRAKSAIIIGDEKQLQPIIKLSRSIETNIRNNIFNNQTSIPKEKLNILDYVQSSILGYVNSKINTSKIIFNKHYRSHDDIVFMYNKLFYRNSLKVFTTNADQNRHVFWQECKDGVTETNRANSKFNRQEAKQVIGLLKQLLEKNKNNQLTIGIVAPYRAQVDLINYGIKNIKQYDINNHQIECLSAHRFQGSEKDIIIYSNVVSGNDPGVWYQKNSNILNVVLSRAKNDLYIIGNKQYCEELEHNHYLKQVVEQYNFLDNQWKNDIFNDNVDINYLCNFLFDVLKKNNIAKFGYNMQKNVSTKRNNIPIVISNNHNKYALLINFKNIEQDMFNSSSRPIILNYYKRRYLKDNGYQIIDIDPLEILFENKKLITKIKNLLIFDVEINEDNLLKVIPELIQNGEDNKTEYKSSLRWDAKRKCANVELENIITQTIASFLNSNGGYILIGVEDNGNIVGLESDYQTFNKINKRDHFSLKLDEIIRNHLGSDIQTYLISKIVNFHSKDICIIKVISSRKPIYWNVNKDFYIRKFASKELLNTEQAIKYIEAHSNFQ